MLKNFVDERVLYTRIFRRLIRRFRSCFEVIIVHQRIMLANRKCVNVNRVI